MIYAALIPVNITVMIPVAQNPGTECYYETLARTWSRRAYKAPLTSITSTQKSPIQS